jgi:AcrR family transcriptional regulator
MPRNHRDVGTQEKRDALLAVARRLFLTEGYDATGMARIAAEAGVAPNTLYWYFDDKDALLIAVLDGLVEASLTEYAKVQSKPLDAQLTWLVTRFTSMPGLIATVHARLALSEKVRAWHDGFHRMVEATIVARLAEHGVPEDERAPAARVAMFVLEGLLSHHAGEPAEREPIVRFVTALVTRGDGAPARRGRRRANGAERPLPGRRKSRRRNER